MRAGHLGDAGADDRFVAGALILAEWTAVARIAVQALGDREDSASPLRTSQRFSI